ncbi:YhgE/Pip family protein [Eubacterium multiforme]|uniref:YhgE/Pip-like protein n=1 Tax=Eubacterium multiforme TaxID=83339 RepID=A0ABT9URG8_9FIRM|nr:YhgE/Pip domain-containing protein [Eubacterium multiforme]MDQ0148440.1 YhgE/Pip-like protein [Eubacterium multiforme]
MRNILKIFKRDIKKVVTNWVAVVVLLGLIILPSLYAWFNIKSSWDPYGSTKGIKIAVVNEDKGASFGGKDLNVGNKVTEELSKNDKIGWQFVSKEKADKGIRMGDYFASIIIPEDFSEDLISPASNKIIKPKLIYTVNESSNAIAPKITDKGVNTLKENVDNTVSETVNGTIFKVLNNVGIEYKSSRDKIREVVDLIYKVNDNMPEIEKLINKAYDGTITIDQMLTKIDKIIPNLEGTLKDANSALNKGKTFLDKSKESFNSLSPIIKEDLIFGKDLLNGASEILGNVSQKYDKDTILKVLNNANNKLTTVNKTLNSVIDILESINKISNKDLMGNTIARLKAIEGKITSVIGEINNDINLVNNNTVLKPESINKLKGKIDSISSNLGEIISKYDSNIVPSINGSLTKLDDMSKNAISLIDSTQKVMPDVKNVVSLLSKGTKLTNEQLIKVKKDFPAFKKSFNKMANQIKKIDNKSGIDEILKIITGDWKKQTDFLVSPVQIETNRLFPVPNYGSAMSPFYTTLALWVGGLILVSILTVKAKPFEDGETLKPIEVFFGKYLTFVTIGILQGAVVTLGDIFILKTYVIHPVLFVLFGMFASLIFITIIYSTVSVFGNVGKAICIIFLVLQVAASGGTFPVEVMSNFFRGINPALPFKYAIQGMRGLVGGVVPELIQKDISVLIIVALIFMIIGILLKKPMNKASEKLVNKLKESDMVEH